MIEVLIKYLCRDPGIPLLHPDGDFLFEAVRLQIIGIMGHHLDKGFDELGGGSVQEQQILPVHPQHIRVASSQMQAQPGNGYMLDACTGHGFILLESVL